MVDANGNNPKNNYYFSYGAMRENNASAITDNLFTGQKFDASTQLYFYNARYYDPMLERFISADSIVPQLGNPQALNRYSYVLNNPLRYIDPSGYDPLDSEWEQAFRNEHNGENPTDQDRRDRLFSIMCPGSGENGIWTAEDWDRYNAGYYNQDGKTYNKFWTGESQWNEETPGLSRFALHTQRLASWYKDDERDLFLRAFAWVFGGVPAGGNWVFAAFSVKNGPDPSLVLYEGSAEWNPELTEGLNDNPSHHYAGLFFLGYYSGLIARDVNYARDWDNPPDIRLGDLAVSQAEAFRSQPDWRYQLSQTLWHSLRTQR